MTRDLILVSRPGEPGQALVAALADRGADVRWLPAFEIAGPPDPAAVDRALARLDATRLVVFVSPTAVQAVATRLPGGWPAGPALAAVGDGTLRHLRDRLRPGAGVPVFAPAGEAGGSEALWQQLADQDWQGARVLVVRAATGREWLGDRLRAAGAAVEELAAYDRRPWRPRSDDIDALRAAAAAGRRAVLVVPSSEAVAALDAIWDAAGVAGWAHRAVALAPHPRIAERLVAAGYADVRSSGWSADAVLLAAAGVGRPDEGTG